MKKKVLIGIAVALVVGFAVWYFFFKESADITTEEVTDPTSVKNKLTTMVSGREYKPEPAVFDNEHPISQGMQGPRVKQLQSYLNKNYNAGLTVDGKWWDKTQKALLNAKIAIPERTGSIYAVLTKSLYDKLELSKY